MQKRGGKLRYILNDIIINMFTIVLDKEVRL